MTRLVLETVTRHEVNLPIKEKVDLYDLLKLSRRDLEKVMVDSRMCILEPPSLRTEFAGTIWTELTAEMRPIDGALVWVACGTEVYLTFWVEGALWLSNIYNVPALPSRFRVADTTHWQAPMAPVRPASPAFWAEPLELPASSSEGVTGAPIIAGDRLDEHGEAMLRRLGAEPVTAPLLEALGPAFTVPVVLSDVTVVDWPREGKLLVQEIGATVTWALLDWAYGDGTESVYEICCYGMAAGGSLRESRNVWFGQEGYLYHPPVQLMLKAFEHLNKYFDWD